MKLQGMDDVRWIWPATIHSAECANFTMAFFSTTHVPYDNRLTVGCRPWEYWAVLRHMQFEPTDVIMDAGAHRTYVIIYLASLGVQQAVGLDNRDWDKWAPGHPYNFDRWTEEIAKYGRPNAVTRDADMRGMPYGNGSFDVILSFSTLEHIDAPGDTEASKEIYRVLKPGGTFAGTVDYGKPEAAFAHNDVYQIPSFYERIVTPAGWAPLAKPPAHEPGAGRSAMVFFLRKEA